jgi:hypothetical protein
MSLTLCPKCNKDCSTSANTCPWCNFKLKSVKKNKKSKNYINWETLYTIFSFIFLSLLLLAVVYMVACEAAKPACVQFETGCVNPENFDKERKWRETYFWWQ